jgi:hypothetical protein
MWGFKIMLTPGKTKNSSVITRNFKRKSYVFLAIGNFLPLSNKENGYCNWDVLKLALHVKKLIRIKCQNLNHINLFILL